MTSHHSPAHRVSPIRHAGHGHSAHRVSHGHAGRPKHVSPMRSGVKHAGHKGHKAKAAHKIHNHRPGHHPKAKKPGHMKKPGRKSRLTKTGHKGDKSRVGRKTDPSKKGKGKRLKGTRKGPRPSYNYARRHGHKVRGGYAYHGKNHRHWDKKHYWKKHRVWAYRDPSTRGWNYWHKGHKKWYPARGMADAPPPADSPDTPPIPDIPTAAPPGGDPIADSYVPDEEPDDEAPGDGSEDDEERAQTDVAGRPAVRILRDVVNRVVRDVGR